MLQVESPDCLNCMPKTTGSPGLPPWENHMFIVQSELLLSRMLSRAAGLLIEMKTVLDNSGR